MQKVAASAVAFLLLAALFAPAQEAKLPVFTLRYSGGVGSEELEDDSPLEPSSVRHSVSLRVKEELSRALVSNLTFFYSTKDYYDEAGDYTYFYLKPQIAYDVSDRVTLEALLRSKWVHFEEPDSSGEQKDYLSLSSAIATTYKPLRGTRITGSLGTGFDLYENESKSEQTYALGLRVLSRMQGVTVGGSYRGTFCSPLGSASEESRSLMSEFGVSLTWDPNR